MAASSRTTAIGDWVSLVQEQRSYGRVVQTNGHAHKVHLDFPSGRCKWLHADEVTFVEVYYFDNIERDESWGRASWFGEWPNAFMSVGEVAASRLSVPDLQNDWHAPVDPDQPPVQIEAVRSGDLTAVLTLFAQPRDMLHWSPDVWDAQSNESTLFIAFKQGFLDILKHLLKASPRYFMEMLTMSNATDFDGGRTCPLKAAVEENQTDVVRWMCETGIMTSTVLEQYKNLKSADPEKRRQQYVWTSAGIEFLIQKGVLSEPGKRCANIGWDYNENVQVADNANFEEYEFLRPVAGTELDTFGDTWIDMEGFDSKGKSFLYDIQEQLQVGHITEAPPDIQAKFWAATEPEIPECENILKEWEALPDADRRRRTEVFFADLIWPEKES